MSETRDERAARLLRTGLDLAVRLRDREDPAEVRETLDQLDGQEMRDLAVLLAACIDVTRPVSELVWWTEEPIAALPAKTRAPRPCGTSAAYRRHVERGQPVDVACESAYLRDEAKRKQHGRNQARETSGGVGRETSVGGTMHGDREEVAA